MISLAITALCQETIRAGVVPSRAAVDAVLCTEFQPQLPHIGGFGGARGNDSGSDRLLHSAVIAKEIISDLGLHPIHGKG
jgi:hypothetical protein